MTPLNLYDSIRDLEEEAAKLDLVSAAAALQEAAKVLMLTFEAEAQPAKPKISRAG